MIEKIFEYFKNSITVSVKSVFYNFKKYLAFFVAISIVQILYGMVTVSGVNGNIAQYKHISEEYNYHMVLKALDDDQMRYLVNYGGSPFKSNQFYDVVDYDAYKNPVTGKEYYDAFIFFNTGDIENCLKRFEDTYQVELSKLGSENTSYMKSLSPLMTYPDTARQNNVTFALISVLLLVLCVFLLSSLYSIRINNYKFEYGVYLTFGADFKMLFSTAFWELFMILLATFIPSSLISTLISYLIYRSVGYGFVISASSFLWIFLFALVTISLSVFMPMKSMSVKQPMSLIIAEDNSNLVTSPRSSLSIFGEKFPFKYELYSAWRFRKYCIQLLTTAIVFCAVFIMALYSSEIYKTSVEYVRPQFTVDMNGTGYIYDERMSEELTAIEGISAIEISDNKTEAIDISSHVLISSDSFLKSGNSVTYDGALENDGSSLRAVNDFEYIAMPKEQLGILDRYDYDGDLSSIEKPGYVLISDSRNNLKAYDIKVGDKIYIGVKTAQHRTLDANDTGRVLLSNQLRYMEFDYIELTVGAVIHDVPCSSTPLYVSTDTYGDVIGNVPESKGIKIYTDPSLTPEEMAETYSSVRAWAHSYGNILISDTDQNLNKSVARDRRYSELFVVISVLILIISPIVWFFSQSLYYSKREKEFNILQSMGAVVSEIRQIYLQGGLLMASLSLVISIALSYLGSYLLYLFCNAVIPFVTGETIRFSFYMPWYAILISIVLSVTCGFLSTYLPYKNYYKHHYSLANGGSGAEYGGDE